MSLKIAQPSNAVVAPGACSIQSESNAYTMFGTLTGHTGLVICMSITDDGKLASDGLDGVQLWDLCKLVLHGKSAGSVHDLQRPSSAGCRGATTALSWIRREDEPENGLIFGTAAGYVVSWKETVGHRGEMAFEETYCIQLAKPGEITAIAFEAGSNQLAVSNRNSVIQVYAVGPKLDLLCIFSVVIQHHIPKALAFGLTSEDKDLYTFGLYDGKINTLSGLDGKVKLTRQIGSHIGNTCINLRRAVFCIDDPTQGVALYRADACERVCTYPVEVRKSQHPRQVTFSEDCKFIVSGSDHGMVYVFDRRSGKMVDQLKSGKGRIQAVTAVEAKVPLIFSAMQGGDDEPCSIVIWKKNIDTPKPEVVASTSHTACRYAPACA